MNPSPSSGSYRPEPEDVYSGDAWAGGSGIALSLLGCLCGLPVVMSSPALKNHPELLPFAMVLLVGCGGLSVFLDYMIVKGRKWAMIVTLVLIALGLLSLLATAGRANSSSTVTPATPLQYLRMFILVFYIPLRLGRAFGPELH